MSVRDDLFAAAGRLLAAEEAQIRFLSNLVADASARPAVANALAAHHRATYEHVERLSLLQKSLQNVEETPSVSEVDGIVRDHERARGSRDPARLTLAAVKRLERFEIDLYAKAIDLAETAGEHEAVEALRRSSEDERLMLSEAERLDTDLALL